MRLQRPLVVLSIRVEGLLLLHGELLELFDRPLPKLVVQNHVLRVALAASIDRTALESDALMAFHRLVEHLIAVTANQ